jgi:hypothetical protein
MSTARGRAARRWRRGRWSVTFLIVAGILFGEALPIGTAMYLTNRSNHQWCALVEVINTGPQKPATGYGLKLARAFNDRARSLGC